MATIRGNTLTLSNNHNFEEETFGFWLLAFGFWLLANSQMFDLLPNNEFIIRTIKEQNESTFQEIKQT